MALDYSGLRVFGTQCSCGLSMKTTSYLGLLNGGLLRFRLISDLEEGRRRRSEKAVAGLSRERLVDGKFPWS